MGFENVRVSGSMCVGQNIGNRRPWGDPPFTKTPIVPQLRLYHTPSNNFLLAPIRVEMTCGSD